MILIGETGMDNGEHEQAVLVAFVDPERRFPMAPRTILTSTSAWSRDKWINSSTDERIWFAIAHRVAQPIHRLERLALGADHHLRIDAEPQRGDIGWLERELV